MNLPTIEMVNPEPITIHGVDAADLVFCIGGNKAWRLRADGAIVTRAGDVVARNLVEAITAFTRAGWLIKSKTNPEKYTGVRWDLIPHSGVDAAAAARAA